MLCDRNGDGCVFDLLHFIFQECSDKPSDLPTSLTLFVILMF